MSCCYQHNRIKFCPLGTVSDLANWSLSREMVFSGNGTEILAWKVWPVAQKRELLVTGVHIFV